MLYTEEIKYTYSDVSIVPAPLSYIDTRSKCITKDEDGYLPLFAAPMNTVVSTENFHKFEECGIHAVLPRTEPIEERINKSVAGFWAAYSLDEFNWAFDKDNLLEGTAGKTIKVLIDVANGHMHSLYKAVRVVKQRYGNNIEIMIGNIANPKAITFAALAGVDYVRCGVGAGMGCITASNSSVHYPMASLISETKKIISEKESEWTQMGLKSPKIVADGGIRNYSDAIKALALGADYVMIGSVFAQAIESSAEKQFILPSSGAIYDVKIEDFETLKLNDDGKTWDACYRGSHFDVEIYSKFYGMASKEAQKLMYGKKRRTAEGIRKTLPVLYKLKQWAENFDDYLKTAMSYTNCENLEEFKNDTTLVVMSQNASCAFNK